MTQGPVTAVDRRQRRRQETVEEVLGLAAQIMAEQGVAGLSIGEIARRMSIRPPSLYVYFPSKHALYDAKGPFGGRRFTRGASGAVANVRRPLSPPRLSAATGEPQRESLNPEPPRQERDNGQCTPRRGPDSHRRATGRGVGAAGKSR